MSWRERPRVVGAIVAVLLTICVLAGLIGAAASGGTVHKVPPATHRALIAARTDAAHWRREAATQHARATSATHRNVVLVRALKHSRATGRAWKTRAQRAKRGTHSHRRHAHRRVHHHHT